MLARAVGLALIFLRSPSRAALESKKPESLAPAAAVYGAFVVGYMLFFWAKPFDFPDVNAPFPREMQGLGFWLKVMCWQPPLEAAWIAFLAGFVAWFSSGSQAVRLVSGVAWTAAPFILMVFYAQAGLGKPLFALGTAVWIGAFVPLWRRPELPWRPLASFMLGINAIGLVALLPMALATALRAPQLYKFAQIASGLWILGSGTAGLRALTGLRLPRAFMAVLFSMFLQIAFAFTLHLLGLVPKDILKALLYA